MKMWCFELVKDILWPKKCLGCGRAGEYVCRKCEVGLWEEEQICPGCGRNSRYGLRHRYCKAQLDGLVCLWAYEGMAKKIITQAKYKGRFAAMEFLISNYKFADNVLMNKFEEFIKLNPTIVPVPLFEKRERQRGFNQAKVTVEQMSRQWRLGMGDLLVRVRDTGQQVGKTREERLKNVQGAFGIFPKHNSFNWPKHVLLVDDVWTTGATMEECARALKKAGVKTVWGIVLAR